MNIDIRDKDNTGSEKISIYPFDSSYIGEAADESDLKIFIRSETLNKIDNYLRSDTNNELGGVLAGDVCINENGKKFIKIDNLIKAKHTASSLSRLTFTHETWADITETLEKDFPDKKILGWFHSHPGHTVFLSKFDLFIQENFFNMDYMVAYVFDPTINDRGFFFWKETKTVKAKGYYIYDMKIRNEKYKPDLIKEPALMDTKDPIKEKTFLPVSNLKNNIILIVVLANFLLLFLMIFNYIDLRKNSLTKNDLASELSLVKTENEKIRQRLDNLIVEYELQKNEISNVENKESNLNKKVTGSVNSADELNMSEKNKTDDIKSDKDVIKYTVKAGDSIEKIVREFYNNRSGIELVMKQNKLKRASDIKIGQVLEIPEPKE
ncbi:MAG: LysM peptidoglycan-binding domain-containing protein [Ignavibacteria bacterium]